MSNDDKDIKPRNDNADARPEADATDAARANDARANDAQPDEVHAGAAPDAQDVGTEDATSTNDVQEQTAGVDTVSGVSASEESENDASAKNADDENAAASSSTPDEGIDEDVNDDIAQTEAESADGKGDVNEYGIDALDISFDTEVDFDALDALGADTDDGEAAGDATGITVTADEAGEAGVAADATPDATAADGASTNGGPTAAASTFKGADTADEVEGTSQETGTTGADSGKEPDAGESTESGNAHTDEDSDASDESADAQPDAAAKPAIAPKASTESIVSSRIDAEVRRRRGIVAPDRYPVYELADVSVARAKTGKAIIEHVDCAFFNGYVNAILVDSDEERQAVMALLSGLALPTTGVVKFRSKPLYEYEMHEYRGHEVGLVFQRFNLRPDLTVLRNIVLAMDASGRNFLKAKDALAKERLAQAGFPEDRADVPVRDLDAFELRRAEIARALCCEANMLILDEPTGGLTDAEADQVFATLERFVKRDDRCVIIVTGRESVADRCASAYAVNATAPEDADADGEAANNEDD